MVCRQEPPSSSQVASKSSGEKNRRTASVAPLFLNGGRGCSICVFPNCFPDCFSVRFVAVFTGCSVVGLTTGSISVFPNCFPDRFSDRFSVRSLPLFSDGSAVGFWDGSRPVFSNCFIVGLSDGSINKCSNGSADRFPASFRGDLAARSVSRKATLSLACVTGSGGKGGAGCFMERGGKGGTSSFTERGGKGWAGRFMGLHLGA